MIYVMSDIHGCYDKYIDMLKLINMSKEDVMYILGDVVDRGPDGIKIILDIINRENVIMLMGNHDHTALGIFKCLIDPDAVFNPDNLLEAIELWQGDGGKPTLNAFLKLDIESQIAIISYLSKVKYYKEITIEDNTYLLSHTVPEKESMQDYSKCRVDDFILGEPDYELVYYIDKYIVTGHTPTGLIDRKSVGHIYKKNNHIAIDCGAVFGGRLGCICLDTGKEYYI